MMASASSLTSPTACSFVARATSFSATVSNVCRSFPSARSTFFCSLLASVTASKKQNGMWLDPVHHLRCCGWEGVYSPLAWSSAIALSFSAMTVLKWLISISLLATCSDLICQYVSNKCWHVADLSIGFIQLSACVIQLRGQDFQFLIGDG